MWQWILIALCLIVPAIFVTSLIAAYLETISTKPSDAKPIKCAVTGKLLPVCPKCGSCFSFQNDYCHTCKYVGPNASTAGVSYNFTDEDFATMADNIAKLHRTPRTPFWYNVDEHLTFKHLVHDSFEVECIRPKDVPLATPYASQVEQPKELNMSEDEWRRLVLKHIRKTDSRLDNQEESWGGREET